MSVQDLLNYEALQGGKDTSAITADANGNVIEILKHLIDTIVGATNISPSADASGSLAERVAWLQANGGGEGVEPIMLNSFRCIQDQGEFFTPGSASATAWPTANKGIFVPLRVSQTVTAVKMWVYNGGAVSGNLDMGIYDESYARLVSLGPTAQSGTNIIQEFDIADTVLSPGRYYMALVSSSASSQVMGRLAGIGSADWKALGLFEQASVGTLPATATPAVITANLLPLFGISLRTLVT